VGSQSAKGKKLVARVDISYRHCTHWRVGSVLSLQSSGPQVTLITTNAEGIEGGKTTIKSRSVDVGIVESATLTDDLTHVEIKARLNSGMEKLRIKILSFGW
jgi:hypothetical protein